MDKNYFQFYETFLSAVETLPENEQLKFYKAICHYGLYGETPGFDDPKDIAIFLQIQFAIDNQNKRRLINRENRLKTGTNQNERKISFPKKTNQNEIEENAEMNRNEMNNELNGNEFDLENSDSEESESSPKKSSRFKKPTVEEIRAYCIERGNTVDPQQFFDYYEANGWMVGKSHMKDWKSAVRNWERNQGKFDGGRRNSAQSNQEIIKANWGENEIPESLF